MSEHGGGFCSLLGTVVTTCAITPHSTRALSGDVIELGLESLFCETIEEFHH
jgi:hypothetical protein